MSFEDGYNRTMKCAGVIDRLMRAPPSLMELPAKQKAMREAAETAQSASADAAQAVRTWKGKDDYVVERTEKMHKALQQATTLERAGDPRIPVRDALSRSLRSQEAAGTARTARNEALKDVGVGAGAVATPFAAYGLGTNFGED